MANYPNPSDSPPSKWYGVSVSPVFLSGFRPKSSVFVHTARRTGPCQRGAIPPPDSPRFLPNLRLTRPGISVWTPPRDTIEYTINPGISTGFSSCCPRPIYPSTPNRPHLVHVNFAVSSSSDSNVSPTQLVQNTTECLQLRAETVEFRLFGKCLLQS